MKSLFEKNRLKINLDLKVMEKRKFFSPGTFGDYNVTVPAIVKYCKGDLIDIGCGDMPYRDIIKCHVNRYYSIDVEKPSPDVKFIGDIQNMAALGNESYDSAVCFEVLEHVPDPFMAIIEIYRILKKRGILIVTVPHLSRIHEKPHDFFRFTHYGLAYLLRKAGFDILDIKPRGGLLCFLGHQLSTFFLCSCWHLPIINNIAFFLNKCFVVKLFYYLDQKLGIGPFPLGYTAVAQKIGEPME